MDLLDKINNKIARLQYVSQRWNEELHFIIESMIKECNEVEKFDLDYREQNDYFFVYITAKGEDGIDSHTERLSYHTESIKCKGFDSPYDFVDFLSDELNDWIKNEKKEEIPELFPGMNEMMDNLTIRK